MRKLFAVRGFRVTSREMPDVKWEVMGSRIVFDDDDDYHVFCTGLKLLFDNICGEVILEPIESYENEIPDTKG
jgi:hypothetical protein